MHIPERRVRSTVQCNVTVQTNRKRQHKAPAQAGRAPWRSAFRQGRRDGGCPGEGRENALSPAAGGATAVPLPGPGAPPGRARPSAPVVPPSGPARPGPREGGRQGGSMARPVGRRQVSRGPAPWGGQAARLVRAESCQVSGILGAFRGSQAVS